MRARRATRSVEALYHRGHGRCAPWPWGREQRETTRGIYTGSATLIEEGILRGYMHDAHSAKVFGVQPTGNGRRVFARFLCRA